VKPAINKSLSEWPTPAWHLTRNPDRYSSCARPHPPGPETAAMSAYKPVTALFDGGRPVCRREVAHYRRLDHAGRIQPGG